MEMKNQWKRVASGFLVICLLVVGIVSGLEQPVSAAAKSYVLEEGKSESIQLDGTGNKEKIRFELQEGVFALYINDEEVYKKNSTAQCSDVYIGSIDKNREVLDIVIALYSQSYTGNYDVVDYCRYENGKFEKIQDLKKYLNTTLEKQIGTFETEDQTNYCYFHPMYSIKESMLMNGKDELKVTLCLPCSKEDAKNGFGTYHADYTLKLKNGKLVKKYSTPKGSMNECVYMMGVTKFYTTPGGTKKAFTAKANEDVYFVEYKYIKSKLFLKAENRSGKTGWVDAAKVNASTGNHIE